MYVIYRFVYIYKFIFCRFTIYLYKITYIFVKFGNFWVVILRKRQFLSFNSSKTRELFLFLRPVWRHSIFLEYLWCREYGGIRSLRVKINSVLECGSSLIILRNKVISRYKVQLFLNIET